MTLDELHKLLADTVKALQDGNVNDAKKIELQILTLQLENQMEVVVFDKLKDLDRVSIVDTSKLSELAEDVQREIQNEQRRAELVGKLIATAKTVIKAAGIPIPS